MHAVLELDMLWVTQTVHWVTEYLPVICPVFLQRSVASYLHCDEILVPCTPGMAIGIYSATLTSVILLASLKRRL